MPSPHLRDVIQQLGQRGWSRTTREGLRDRWPLVTQQEPRLEPIDHGRLKTSTDSPHRRADSRTMINKVTMETPPHTHTQTEDVLGWFSTHLSSLKGSALTCDVSTDLVKTAPSAPEITGDDIRGDPRTPPLRSMDIISATRPDPCGFARRRAPRPASLITRSRARLRSHLMEYHVFVMNPVALISIQDGKKHKNKLTSWF